jgi:peptide/nickel transport system permease protein
VSAGPVIGDIPPLPRRLTLLRRRAGTRSGGNRALVVGLTILGLLLLAAILAPVLAPADPRTQDIAHALAAPGTAGHPLGTDHLGRDVLSRLLYGARTDLFVGIAGVFAPLVLGTILGAVAGYAGGWVDAVLMRIVDLVFAFPVMVLLIALVFFLQPGVVSILVAVTVVDWVAYARLTRAQVMVQKELDYVLAAKTGGLSSLRVLGRHILPNVISQNVVYAVSDAVLVILAITTLGFLGLGVPPPAADWGGMISDAQPYIDAQWWLAVFPGVAIAITGLALSLTGDGLATRLDRR